MASRTRTKVRKDELDILRSVLLEDSTEEKVEDIWRQLVGLMSQVDPIIRTAVRLK